MKIFQTIRKQYAIMGISSSNQTTQKYPFNNRILWRFLVFGYSVVSLLVDIFHVASNFMEYLECFCTLSAMIVIFVAFVTMIFKRTKLFECIDNIEKLIDTKRNYPKSKRLFRKTNRQVERLSKLVFTVLVRIAPKIAILPKFIVSFVVYFIADSGSDAFQLPFAMGFPFNLNNPIGYLIAVIIEYVVLGYGYFIVACTLSLGIGIGAFLFTISTSKEIQHILHSIDDELQTNENRSNELRTLFSVYIHTHTAIKQVVHDFSNIFQPIIMSLFTWSLLTISGAMLVIQLGILDHGNEDVMAILLSVALNGFFGLTLVFIACEIGHRMNDAFEKIDFNVDQFDWHLFPIEIKRMLPMIIANAQQTVPFQCFGSITCSRDVFKKMVHSAYSYFMTIRQFDN